MKIIKKILLPLVLFLGLFFNSSTVFASNNLSASFSVNNDELTIKVKNTSGKEVSDVEYNLNLPSEYTANYTSYPKYTLAPNEETSFKVKVANSDIKTNDGVKEKTKSYPAIKKLSNTGEASQTAVGIMILLLLAVGLLLYFKQRKLLIIIITVGLGTQLLSSYSLAAEKVKFSEHFDDKIVLFNNNTKVSLDISYLIEGNYKENDIQSVNSSSKGLESTNSSKNESSFTSNLNNVNSNKTNKNSGTDNVKSKEKDPKEVLVAGYALAGKTSVGLENKELKIFDGDKEITTVVTDSEGYFFTHLIQDKTYTIKGEDFEVTLTAKNNGDYKHNDVVGKINLGRVIQDENTYIKVNPSVAFISEDIEYGIEGGVVTIDGIYKLKKGDKIILGPSHNNLTGSTYWVESIQYKDGKTVLTGSPITTLNSIVDEFVYNEEIDISSMKVTPSKGVEILEEEFLSPGSSFRDINGSIKRKVKYNFDENNFFELSIKGGIKFNISSRKNQYIMKPSLELEEKASIVLKDSKALKGSERIKRKKLFDYYKVTQFGVAFGGEVYAYIDLDGEIKLNAENKTVFDAKIGFENNNWKVDPKWKNEFSANIDLSGKFTPIGLESNPTIYLYKLIKVIEPKISLGIPITGKVKGEVKKKYDENPTLNLKGNVDIDGLLKAEITSEQLKPILKVLKIKDTYEAEIKYPILSWANDNEDDSEKDKNVDKNKDGDTKDNDNSDKVSSKSILNKSVYKEILDKYKTAISGGIIDPSINSVAVHYYLNKGKKDLGDNALTYGFYDINKDGKDELLLFTQYKGGRNEYYPMDIYARRKDNKPVRLTPEGVNGERTNMMITKEKSNFIVRGSSGAWTHGYEFYKLKDSGTSIEKTDSFSFDASENKPEVYERTYPSKTKEVLPRAEFEKKYLKKEKDYMKFDYSKQKSITE